MLENLSLYVSIGGFVGLFLGLLTLFRPHARYNRDGRNPYRRYCARCGQCQIAYSHSDSGPSWWETTGEIRDFDCLCHDDAEYRG